MSFSWLCKGAAGRATQTHPDEVESGGALGAVLRGLCRAEGRPIQLLTFVGGRSGYQRFTERSLTAAVQEKQRFRAGSNRFWKKVLASFAFLVKESGIGPEGGGREGAKCEGRLGDVSIKSFLRTRVIAERPDMNLRGPLAQKYTTASKDGK